MYSEKITEKQNLSSIDIDEKEILEILEIINKEDQTVAFAVKQSLPMINEFIQNLLFRIKKGGRLFYVGSGTSGRLGVLDAAECPPTYSVEPELIQGIIAGGYDALIHSIEGAEDFSNCGAKEIIKNNIDINDTVLGITASSSAPFVLGALNESKIRKAYTALLTCNDPTELDYVDQIISVIVGPEIITGSTRMKAGTATKLILNMITTTLMIKLNKTYGNIMVDLKASNKKLWDRGARIIQHITSLNYKDSLSLLQTANGEVKIALIMQQKQINYDEAKLLLKKFQGKIKPILLS